MSEERDDLRSIGESIAADAQRLREIETEKADLPPDDPRVLMLSEAAVRLVEVIARKTESQRALANDVAGGASSDPSADASS